MPTTSSPRLVTETYVFNHDWQVSITYEQFKSKWNNTNSNLVIRSGRMLVSKVPGPTACTLLLLDEKNYYMLEIKSQCFTTILEDERNVLKHPSTLYVLQYIDVFCFRFLIYWQTHVLYIELWSQSSFNYRIKHFYSKCLKHRKGEICNLTVLAKAGS